MKLEINLVGKSICEEAAKYLGEAVLKGQEVPPGSHDVGGCRIILVFPEIAVVSRGAGSNGDGTDATDPKGLELTHDAALLFIETMSEKEINSPARRKALWAECIRNALKGQKTDVPAEAVAALELVQAEQPQAEPGKRKLPAKRIGVEGVTVTVEGPKPGKLRKA